MEKPKVVIAGATGFIGRHLATKLSARYDVIGLTRLPKPRSSDSVTEWRSCDLLSLKAAENALEGAEIAFYLVHSMMPSARLSQGSFWDYDLIAADNFARAAKKAGVRRIIYLGGLVPSKEVLSRHLQSRFEVETALRSYGVPVTTLRAGMVVGAEGSSFLTMLRLVQRLPVLICPPWADTISHPVALEDVVTLLAYCLDDPRTLNQTFDIGGPELMSYANMVLTLADCLGIKKPVIRIPINHTRLIQWFVSRIANAPAELVDPLIESLQYPIVARERKLNALADLPGTSFADAVRRSVSRLEKVAQLAEPVAFQKQRSTAREATVRSVQRFSLPPGKNADWVAREYLNWLPRGLLLFLEVAVQDPETYSVRLRFFRKCSLLILERIPDRSWPDRQLFLITGGVLAKSSRAADGKAGFHSRLEFREALQGTCVLAAIHDYRPALPWFIYTRTQAKLHLWVMKSFEEHLERVAESVYDAKHQGSKSL